MRYFDWLHGRWPAGRVESLPEVREGGLTRVPGLRVVGDLAGVPLLKFAAESGAKAVRALLSEPEFAARRGQDTDVFDLAILGCGVAGLSAALEAKKAGLSFVVLESRLSLATITDFPARKPIFTYPLALEPASELVIRGDTKEALFADLEAQRVSAGIEPRTLHVTHVESRRGELVVHGAASGVTTEVRALRVVVALGRSGAHRTLGVPGEDGDHVRHRLLDPAAFSGKSVVVVGGGDSAAEAAIALTDAGARVTLAHRSATLTRLKPDNLTRLEALARTPGDAPRLRIVASAQVRELRADAVTVEVGAAGEAVQTETVPSDQVFVLIGREAPLDFFRRSGVPIRGERTLRAAAGLAALVALCTFLGLWKGNGTLNALFVQHRWFPYWVPGALSHLGHDPATVFGTLRISLGQPAFYYSLAYSVAVAAFGMARIRRRRTPYVTAQTLTLISVQVGPLFLLPYLLLPWLGHLGAFDHGAWKTVADNLFPVVPWDPQGREYWRSCGFILAWPLFIWNAFTAQPMGWWLAIGGVQTFVVIPLMVWRWGKGAYCGFICSCGALAETLGDTEREKMPHGPLWNRLNLVGQGILGVVTLLFVMRLVSWTWPHSVVGRHLGKWFYAALSDAHLFGVHVDYYHFVDLFLSGIVGVGFYFWASGRVWCRFACPLAALMNVYARFTRFRIFADKPKCISCNVCTSVCHQGVDVMGFASRGAPMEDPQCVRCSACVQACPTGVLSFGRVGADGLAVYDTLSATPAQAREGAGKRRLPLIR